MELKFRYLVTLEDYSKFNYEVEKKQIIATYITGIIICIGLHFYILQIKVWAILFGLITYFIILRYEINKKIKEVYESDKSLKSEVEVIINEEEIKEKSVELGDESTFKLKNIFKFVESKGYFYVFLAENKAIILPKRIMSDDEKQKFLEIMNNIKK